jgi:hypothetical protein
MSSKSEIRDRIASVGLCTSLRHRPDDYAYFRALFQRHPEAERKRVCDIVDIFIEQVRGEARLGYVCSDGTRDTISWNKCLSGKLPHTEAMLSRVLRQAVVDQTLAYKRTQPPTCVLCGTTSNPSVDHYPTKFRDIRNAFLEGRSPPTVFAKTTESIDCFRPEDAEFKSEWVRYHRERATYRILCCQCNRTSEFVTK